MSFAISKLTQNRAGINQQAWAIWLARNESLTWNRDF
jgi:hypothetical protein